MTALAFWLSFALVLIGLFTYGFSLAYFQIAPGYLNLLDYQAIDLIRLKLWSHIDSYYFGILAAFLFEKMKEVQ